MYPGSIRRGGASPTPGRLSVFPAASLAQASSVKAELSRPIHQWVRTGLPHKPIWEERLKDNDASRQVAPRITIIRKKKRVNMESFHEFVNEYKQQLEKGVIQKAYKGLMEYVMALRMHFKNKYPDYFVSGSIYYGYMDMTYFSLVPKSLKHRKLKIAIVFIHDTCRFEVWLAGYNKQVQTKYWKMFKESDWNKYHIVSTTKGADSIVEYIVVDNPDFSDLDTLTKQIEKGTLNFIKDVENFLSNTG